MNKISGLKKILSQSFAWNKARLDCLARLMLSLIAVRTVNLKEIALGFASPSQPDSRYRRLQRFFALFKWDYGQLARWLFYWFFNSRQKVYLIIDRTNWYWGKQKINILMLSVAYEGLAVPLMWQMLDKAGNASSKEHQAIIARYVAQFGAGHIMGVLADREFANGGLFGYLLAQRIPFFIRIKDNSQVCIGKKRLFSAYKIFNHLQNKQKLQFGCNVCIFGHSVYLSASRSERGELMVVATAHPHKNAIAVYLRRWEIENLFQGLKGRGFRFEETHLVKAERVSALMAVLAITFCWSHKIGEWKAIRKPIASKRFVLQAQQRPQHTFFRYGLDHIRTLLLNLCTTPRRLFDPLLRLLPKPEAIL